MIQHSDHFHGSDLETIEKIYGIHKDEILSFSANVNPLGLSLRVKEELSQNLDAITAYPDREYTSLRQTIGAYCEAPWRNVVVGNGSTELISLMIQIKRPKKALILGPTYSEYEREVSIGGGTSLYFPLEEAEDFRLNTEALSSHLNESLDLLVICNPNNPTSSAIPLRQMRRILDTCKRYDIFVMVDETYVEFAEKYDDITSVPLTHYYNNLVILRGISKFFASPGLRLGYAVTGNQDLIHAINDKKNPWTINSLAEVAGRLLFTDRDYIERTRKLVHDERIRITKALSHIEGLKVYPPLANFILVRIMQDTVDADTMFDAAIRQKMMIRNCSTFPFLDNSYFRFCFMKPEDNDRLLACIRKVMEK